MRLKLQLMANISYAMNTCKLYENVFQQEAVNSNDIIIIPKQSSEAYFATKSITTTKQPTPTASESHKITSEPFLENNSTTTTVMAIESMETSNGPKKDGFNYASFDCGAVVRQVNAEAKHSTSILINAKDAYLLNECSVEKFVEIELCQDILVNTVSLANFEYFSSMFKDFSVFGSSKYPAEWVPLGNYSAKNSRDRQNFAIEDPMIWSKYIRIEFKSHYGNEYYCPLTSVQVFGTTMMDQVKGYQDNVVH